MRKDRRPESVPPDPPKPVHFLMRSVRKTFWTVKGNPGEANP